MADDTTSLAVGAAIAAGHAVDKAEQAECRAFMAAFDPRSATVEERRRYAACVLRVDGDGRPKGRLTGLLERAGVLVVLLGAGYGAYFGYDGAIKPIPAMLLFGVLGAGITLVAVSLVALFAWAVLFVLGVRR